MSASAVKVLIAGGFGAGKTTLVGSVSEIVPLRTEEMLSLLSSDVDEHDGRPGKATTTVALDFGRITISSELILYLFGTPGQERFRPTWDDLARNCLGAIVLADTKRLDASFPAIDFFESRRIPFVVGINRFTDSPPYTAAEVRLALDLAAYAPVLLCDARQRESSKQLLLTLMEHVIRSAAGASKAPRVR